MLHGGTGTVLYKTGAQTGNPREGIYTSRFLFYHGTPEGLRIRVYFKPSKKKYIYIVRRRNLELPIFRRKWSRKKGSEVILPLDLRLFRKNHRGAVPQIQNNTSAPSHSRSSPVAPNANPILPAHLPSQGNQQPARDTSPRQREGSRSSQEERENEAGGKTAHIFLKSQSLYSGQSM